MSDEDTPQFEHDCDRCLFLGRYNNVDLYVCARSNIADTVIARHSSEGSDYTSGLIFAHRNIIPDLSEAMERAIARGIDCSKGD